MKKITAMLLVLVMAVSLFAGCNSNQPIETPNETTTVGSALEVLENTWAQFPEDEQFYVYGGAMEDHAAKAEADPDYQVPNGPCDYNMAYAEGLAYTLLIPAEQMTNVDQAATMVHGMLANNFTSGVVHLAAGTDVAAFAAAVHESIKNNPWMCGFPEKELIAVVGGEYVLISFGINDAMTPFQTHFAAAYPQAEILYNDNLA